MAWTVALHDEFDLEFDALPEAVRKELIAMAGLLEEYGPGSAVRTRIRYPGRGMRT